MSGDLSSLLPNLLYNPLIRPYDKQPLGQINHFNASGVVSPDVERYLNEGSFNWHRLPLGKRSFVEEVTCLMI